MPAESHFSQRNVYQTRRTPPQKQITKIENSIIWKYQNEKWIRQSENWLNGAFHLIFTILAQ